MAGKYQLDRSFVPLARVCFFNMKKFNPFSLSTTRQAAETAFITDKHGTMFFFPWGKRKNGYIITNREIYDQFVRFYSITLLIAQIVFALCLALADYFKIFEIILIGSPVCFFSWWFIYRSYAKKIVENLPVANQQYEDIVLENWIPNQDENAEK
jgi:hypothetical protein